MDDPIKNARVDRTAFKILHSFAEADAEDRAYWHSRTPEERWEYMEVLRRINYGHRATERFQRVIEFVQRTRS